MKSCFQDFLMPDEYNIRKDISKMRKLPKESIIYIFNKLEDMTGSGTTPKLTIGVEGMRNLTLEEKAIATNKGWILA